MMTKKADSILPYLCEEKVTSRDSQFSWSLLTVPLNPSSKNLDLFKDSITALLLKNPGLIILGGPNVRLKDVDSLLTALDDSSIEALAHHPQSLLGFFSSGSTGEPKLILHQQRSLLQSAQVSGELLELKKDSLLLSSLPLFHVGGFLCFLRGLLFDCSFKWLSAQELSSEAHGDSIVVGVPAQLEHLIGPVTFYAGGDKVKESHWQKCQQRHQKLVATYGQTESCGALLYQREAHGEIEPLSDVTIGLQKLSSNEAQLSYKTSRLAYGYINQQGLTRLESKDFYLTQDLVATKDQKIIEFTGRLDRQFQCGGEMISPEKLERELLKTLKHHPLSISQVLVTGISHSRLGLIPVAFLKGADQEALSKLKTLLSFSSNDPARLRALALWPTSIGGIKPSLSELESSFQSFHIDL